MNTIKNDKENHQTASEENERIKEHGRTTKTEQKTGSKMAIKIYLKIITLNVNLLNAPLKRHRVSD